MRTEVPRNQLDQVICQLRFPARLSVERNIDRFQDAVRNDYPEYSQEQIVPIGVANPPSAGHVFASSDGGWFINVSTGAISLTSRRYTDWVDFESRLGKVLSVFHDTFGVDSFSRIGLRYINAIRSSALDLDGSPGSVFRGPVADLFNPSIGTFRAGSVVLDRNYKDGVFTRTAAGSIVFTDGQPGFVIDNDVFTNVPTPYANVIQTLITFNAISVELFEETASEELCRKVGLCQ